MWVIAVVLKTGSTKLLRFVPRPNKMLQCCNNSSFGKRNQIHSDNAAYA